MSYKSEIFKDVLENFETKEMKDYCIDLLEERDTLNYTIPSSTSYKYHNATQCKPGGQVMHEIMVATIMNYLLGLEHNKNKYDDPVKRDCMRIAAILHDCKKTNGGQYTVHEHPILGAEFILNTKVKHDISQDKKQFIADLIKSHSGEWISSRKSKTILPKPDTESKMLLHECDYLSSRKDLDMIYSDNIIRLIKNHSTSDGISDPNKYIIKFGKYRGKTFNEVLRDDKEYLLWLRDKSEIGTQKKLNQDLTTLLESI